MELNEFYKTEMFSADFEENTITFEIEGDFSVRAGKYFIFSEKALQNFADRICERQRENCSRSFIASQIVDKINIISAEQPKIDEL